MSKLFRKFRFAKICPLVKWLNLIMAQWSQLYLSCHVFYLAHFHPSHASPFLDLFVMARRPYSTAKIQVRAPLLTVVHIKPFRDLLETHAACLLPQLWPEMPTAAASSGVLFVSLAWQIKKKSFFYLKFLSTSPYLTPFSLIVLYPGRRLLLTASGIAVEVWSLNTSWELTWTQRSLSSSCHHTTATAQRCWRTAPHTPASPAWNAAVQLTPITTQLTRVPQPCIIFAEKLKCTGIPEVCPTWSSTILVIITHLTPQRTMHPVPTMLLDTRAQTWIPTPMDLVCTKVTWKAATTSTRITKWMAVTDTADSGTTTAMGQTVFLRILMPRWGPRGVERAQEMTSWPRTCRKLWWQSI